MGVTLSDNWRPTPAAPTRVFDAAAGVTQRGSFQITNNTNGEVWLSTSATAPTSVEQARFVCPPRATAKFPLEYDTISARWNSLVSADGDLITFVFTDDLVEPQVIPGVQALGGLASPVQTLIINPNSVPVLPYNLLTSSGKNVGSVFMYNKTNQLLTLQIPPPVNNSFYVPPYSWACVPVNVASTNAAPVRVQMTQFTVAADMFPSDNCYIAWSDTDYVAPFPVGAGKLPDPTESPMPSMAGTYPSGFPNPFIYPTSEFSVYQEVLAAGAVVLFNILPDEAIFIKSAIVEVWSNGVAATGYIEATGGLNGTTATAVLARTRVAAGGVLGSVSHNIGLVVRNRSVAAKAIQLQGVGGIVQATATLTGWRIF